MREIVVVVSNDNEEISSKETIKSISEAGFKNVFIQWYDKKFDYSQEEQLEYIKQKGLNVIFAHLGYRGINAIWENDKKGDLLVDKYLNNIDKCYSNNIPMVVMHLVNGKKAPMFSEVGLDRIKKIADYAKSKNIKVAFENTKIKGYLEYVLRNIKSSNVGICYDAGHCHAHFNDDFNFGFFKNRIFAVHLHDNDKSDDLHLLPFDGTIDWENVIKKLKENNYNGPVTLELCYRRGYLKTSPLNFYKEGYEIGERLRNMFSD